MICKKDDGNGKAFWTVATAGRVILSKGGKVEQMPHMPMGWYLLVADDEYWLYPVEKIERITCSPGSLLMAYPVGEPYAIYSKYKYKYKYNGNTIEIIENSDDVSHPPHYANDWSNGAEVIDLTEHLSFCAGNVVKYVCRAGRKDPDKHVEDLKKARWYIDREIERVEGR